MKRHSAWRSVVVLAITISFFASQVTWALAGVTGGVSGTITDDSGAPVAGASVSMTSPSQNATGRTDAGGHFNFLALDPDTYTLSVQKDGFNPISVTGVTVFADNNQVLSLHVTKVLKEIAKVTSRSAGSLVKSGVGSDIYNVNASTIQAASALGGGTNLNSAYSAIASVPGVTVSTGAMGWNQNVYVRGSQSYFTGYEYDGVPVNRSFDNYNASTESNLGLQELQVYTGGGPAQNSSSGTSGFINQVIKTGTFPGYATFSGGIASDTFYHQLKVEAGGASPDRNFSYYVGLSGYDQAFRFLNNQNGANLMGPGGIYSANSIANAPLANTIATSSGAYPYCNTSTGATPTGTLGAVNASNTGGIVNPLLVSPTNPTGSYGAFCLVSYTGVNTLTSNIFDRENVINFHFGIPRKNGQKDDVQLLWSGSMLKTQIYSSVNDIGGYNAFMLAEDGQPYQAGVNYPQYLDGYVFNAPFGANASSLTPSLYLSPDSPAGRLADAQIPANSEDATYNDQGIVKLQYTHPIGDRAYVRADAYTFFSDWNLEGDTTSLNYFYGAPTGALANNYLLNTHTTGAEFQFSDQVNDKNLVQFTTNYTSARVLRDNNETNIEAAAGLASPFGLVSGSSQGNFQCWNPGGPATASNPTPDTPTPCGGYSLGNATTVQNGSSTPAMYAAGPNASAAGASFINLWSGPVYASYNTVDPKFLNASLSDQYRPNDRWLINGAVRFEDYTYDMPDSATEADQYYAQIAADEFCYATPGAMVGGSVQTPGVYSAPLLPGQVPPADPIETASDCNAAIGAATGQTATGFVHPNGVTQDGVAAPSFTAAAPNSYNLNYWSARYSATYTESPDTVWRVSGGRFIEPPISASVQYLNASGNNTKQWANFMSDGFFSPFHNTPSMTSGQYDLSLERHIHGTDVSFKLSPFYNITNGYQEQSFIGPGYVTQVPVGRFRSYGLEGALTKGDFSKNGLSGMLSVTYTKAQVQFQSGLVNNLGVNQISYFNTAIGDYNALAKGGSQNYPCFTFANAATNSAGAGVGTPGVAQACTGNTVANPYFSAPKQAMMDPSAWYAPAGNVVVPGVNNAPNIYNTPWNSSLILNYRHDKWAVTPSVQLLSGSSAGTPFAVQGVDPRLCTAIDSTQTGNQCAYTSLIGQGATTSGLLYIPNPQTGSFDGFGQYTEPNMLIGNMAFSYDVTPKISLNLTMSNIFHTCFGGMKEPWSAAFQPGPNVCGYFPNPNYVSNYQLGAGYLNPGNISAYSANANGTKLAPFQEESYTPFPSNGAGNQIPPPFNVYLTVNFRL